MLSETYGWTELTILRGKRYSPLSSCLRIIFRVIIATLLPFVHHARITSKRLDAMVINEDNLYDEDLNNYI